TDGYSATLGVALGITTLTGIDGVGPAIMPMARADVALSRRFALQAAVAGLGSRPRIDAASYSAELQQQYAVLGARYRFTRAEQWYPFLGLSVGVLATSVEGTAQPPARGRDEHLRSLLVEASVGTDWQLSDRYYSSVAAHVHVAQPSASVHIVDKVVATTGRPNLALTLSFGAWL